MAHAAVTDDAWPVTDGAHRFGKTCVICHGKVTTSSVWRDLASEGYRYGAPRKHAMKSKRPNL